MLEIRLYKTAYGEEPFAKWVKSIKSATAKNRILKAVTKMEAGLISDVVPVGDGVLEQRLHFEAGYRVYFANDGAELIILLAGSTKKNQQKEIEKAKEYWNDYKRQKVASRKKKGD